MSSEIEDSFNYVSSTDSVDSSTEKTALRRRFKNKSGEPTIPEEEDDHKLIEAKDNPIKPDNDLSFPIHQSSLVIILVAIIFRLLVALHSYSGEGVAPIYGDFEAQRHWMEITINLPLRDWYRNTGANDLKYWGLDYPPLSAYWAYLTGYM